MLPFSSNQTKIHGDSVIYDYTDKEKGLAEPHTVLSVTVLKDGVPAHSVDIFLPYGARMELQ